MEKLIVEEATNWPLFKYFTLREDEKSYLIDAGLITNNHKPLESIIVIDRKYLQRLIREWSDYKSSQFLTSFYRGLDKADFFVVVDIYAIIKVYKELQKHIKKYKKKATIDEFLVELQNHKENGIKWFLINGQHRINVFQRFFNDGQIKLNEDFNDGSSIDGQRLLNKTYKDLSLDIRIQFLLRDLPVVLVKEIGSPEDLKEIVIRHNTGNSWTPHQERMRNTSYIARKFAELDEDSTMLTVFNDLTGLSFYEPPLNGVSLLALQMFMIYINDNKNPKIHPRGTERDNGKVLNEIVTTESPNWDKDVVDDFLKFFKDSVYQIYKSYLVKTITDKKRNLKATKKRVIPNNITTLKVYLLYRMLLNGRLKNILDIEKNTYRINDIPKFVDKFVVYEETRRRDRNQFTNPTDLKKYDSIKKENYNSKSEFEKAYAEFMNTRPSNCYQKLLAGMNDEDNLFDLLTVIKNDFLLKFHNGDLNNIVVQIGEKVSNKTKSIIEQYKRNDSVIETIDDYGVPNISDVGHKLPVNKGGKATLDNLDFEEPRSGNRISQDRY